MINFYTPLLLFSMLFLVINSVPAQRIIHFAGVDWQVKDGGPWGPGPNFWSGSENSVWVDDAGRLHLKIRKDNGRWYCAEVNTTEYTSYGEHRFLVEGMIDRMDKNLVLGLFIYASDTQEIDVEYSKWGVEGKTDVGSFTVQPYTTPGNQHSFESPLDSAKTTHFFNWQPGYVSFGSMHGHYYGAPPSSKYYIEQWVYTGADIPDETGHLHTHLNLWLLNGQAPTDLSVVEVVISDVVQPLSTSMIKNHGLFNMPKEFELEQNFPNPFNPFTAIKYRLSKAGHVTLIVYNTAGQEIERFVNKRQSAGLHHIVFDSKQFPSGVYYYRLQVGSQTETKKMVLLR